MRMLLEQSIQFRIESPRVGVEGSQIDQVIKTAVKLVEIDCLAERVNGSVELKGLKKGKEDDQAKNSKRESLFLCIRHSAFTVRRRPI
jgi:hypothetical protein